MQSVKKGFVGELEKCKDHLNGDQYELLRKALDISHAVLALCGGLHKKQASIAAECEAAEGEMEFMKRFLGRCHSHQCEDNMVQLNVSGKAMETFRSTLLWQEGSTLAAKFGGAWTMQSEEMVDGGVFFDEDPSLFSLLLLHLRLGSMLGESFVPRVPDEKLGAWQRFIKYLNLDDALTPDSMMLDSLILAGSTNELKQLSEWLPKKKTTLLFRATRDGFDSATWHQKCDGKGPTVVIAKSAGGHIFGGYTETAWDSSNQYKHTRDSFLFRLSGPGGVGPSQHRIFQNFQEGIFCGSTSNCGPCFGSARNSGGHDMIFLKTGYVEFRTFGNTYDRNGTATTFLAESQNATCHKIFILHMALCFLVNFKCLTRMTPHVNDKRLVLVVSEPKFSFECGEPPDSCIFSPNRHTSSVFSIHSSELSHSLVLKDMLFPPRSPCLSMKYFPWKMIEHRDLLQPFEQT